MPEYQVLHNAERKAIQGQINVDEAQGIVECFVAGIGNKDSVGDICAPGCFTESLKRRKPRVVWGHNWNEPIGKVLEIYEVRPGDPRLPRKMQMAGIGGLFARVQFNLKSERGKQAFSDVAFFGEEQEWSIGYKTLNADYDPARQANVLREVELYEVSPVLHGANQLTGTISIKSDSIETNSLYGSEFDEFGDYAEFFGEKSEEPLRDPEGGLTAAGRRHFARTQGAKLKPGVTGAADTPEKMRRKGSFLTRFFTNPSGPMKNDKGEPTRLALSAHAWGEPVPQNMEDAAKLAAKGRRLLERYQSVKKKGYDDNEIMYDNDFSDDEDKYPRRDDDAIPAANPAMGRMGNLARALVTRFRGSVRLRQADENQVIFDHMNESGEKHTFRLSYHYEDGLFMFGDPVPVKPEVVYLDEDERAVGETPKPGDGRNPFLTQYRDEISMPGVPSGVQPKVCDCGCMGEMKESNDQRDEVDYMRDEMQESMKRAAPMRPNTRQMAGLARASGVSGAASRIPTGSNAIPDTLPQERVTGDVLHGYGPRRGNLERLLRYWRPIMRKEGGFRRCRVILADHPELYPLNNICAWLHHETTGLWPNEGCHHPGMKNCRRKIKKIVNGSIWDDKEWERRMSARRAEKALDFNPYDDDESIMGNPQEVENNAVEMLRKLVSLFPDFIGEVEDDDNWEHVGDSHDGMEVVHVMMPTMPGMPSSNHSDCGCGCGGAGSCKPNPLRDIMQAMSTIGKSIDDDMSTKAGRVINNRNMAKLQQAIDMLQEVIESASKAEMQVKADGQARIVARVDELYNVKTVIDPVLNYHSIDTYITESGIYLKSALTTETSEALMSALDAYNSEQKMNNYYLA